MHIKSLTIILSIFLITGSIIPTLQFSESVKGEEWKSELIDDSCKIENFISIDIDNLGDSHVSYFDQENKNLKYAHQTEDGWIIETVDSNGWVGEHNSLKLGPNDHPHISYYDRTNDALKLAVKTETGWEIDTIDESAGMYSSLEIDEQGYAHISYYDGIYDNLKYITGKGENWSSQVVDDQGDVGKHTSIALDRYGNPHIAYKDGSHLELKYSHWVNDSWFMKSFETVDPVQIANLGTKTGQTTIVFVDKVEHELQILNWTGSEWRYETIDQMADIDKGISAALSKDGTIYVSYKSMETIKLARFYGGEWFTQVVDTGEDKSGASDLAFDGHGNLSIAYSKDSVLRYANSTANVPIKPEKPMGVFARSVDGRIKVFWKEPEERGNLPIVKYKIYRGSNGNDLHYIAEVNSTKRRFTDDNVTLRRKYTYQVSAVNDIGEGHKSELASVKVFPKIYHSKNRSIEKIYESKDIKHASYDNADDFTVLVYNSYDHTSMDFDITSYLTWKYDGSWETKVLDKGIESPIIRIDQNKDVHLAFNDESSLNYLFISYDSFKNGDLDISNAEKIEGRGHLLTMRIDDICNPHIFQLNYEVDCTIYTYKDDGQWITEQLNITGIEDLYLDSECYPHIFYYRSPNLYHFYKSGETWIDEKVTMKEKLDYTSSFIMDKENTPHLITYSERSYVLGQKEIGYQYLEKGKWKKEVIYRTEKNLVITYFAFDSNCNPYIIFCTEENESLDFYIGIRKNNTWDIETFYNYNYSGNSSTFAITRSFVRIDEDEKSLNVVQMNPDGYLIEIKIKPRKEGESDEGFSPHLSLYIALVIATLLLIILFSGRKLSDKDKKGKV